MSDVNSFDSPPTCACLDEPQTYTNYETVTRLGVDETHGRFGEVSLWRCKQCGQYWLHYFVEYEHRTASGRYFMGLITPDRAQTLKPEDAVAYLASLDWYLYGGSYFGGKGRRPQNYPISVD